MLVILPVSILFGSLGTMFFIISRRLKLVNKTIKLQQEIEVHQKSVKRARKKKKIYKEKVLKELKRASDLKHKSLRNLGAINELMKKVDHDLIAGNDQEARRTLIQVISLDENHRKGNELLAKLYLHKSRNRKAELIYKKLIELHPFDSGYYTNLAQSFLYRHQFKAATGNFEKALELDKNNPQYYINIGQVYAIRKDYESALSYFTKAHRINVRDIDLMFVIIEMCLNNHDPISAREYLHKVLDYEPYNHHAKSLLGEVLRDLKETV